MPNPHVIMPSLYASTAEAKRSINRDSVSVLEQVSRATKNYRRILGLKDSADLSVRRNTPDIVLYALSGHLGLILKDAKQHYSYRFVISKAASRGRRVFTFFKYDALCQA